jgi:hypothetical protein
LIADVLRCTIFGRTIVSRQACFKFPFTRRSGRREVQERSKLNGQTGSKVSINRVTARQGATRCGLAKTFI